MQVAHQSKQVKWDDLYFLAEASEETFRDVSLITAKSAYVGKIEESLLERALKESNDFTFFDINWNAWLKTAVKSNSFAKKIFITEYVEVQPTHITICLNRDVVDDEFISKAIEKLAEALETLNGGFGTVVDKKKYFFSLKDIPWLHTH